jgi:DNA-binding transcriptional MerR regulator/methylmalonyl-CoA mutase cobalamin-binding subunit
MKDALGRYRINVVAELTGVPAATLRAWERRYGIPTPARTAAAYRLYSDVDVAELKRMRDLCAGGMAIAEAARLVRGDRSLAPPPPPPPVPVGDLPAASALAVDGILAAVRAFDPSQTQHEVARALYLGCAHEVFDRVYGPALQRVGELWHEGHISVAQEHMAAVILSEATTTLARLVQPSEPRWRVLLACVDDEEHVIGLYGAAIQMAGWGIRSVILGARTPPEAVRDAIQHLDPDAVGLSTTFARERARGSALVDAYASACEGRPWFVGGAGADELVDRVRARGGLALVGPLADHRAAIERALAWRASPFL